MNTIIEIALGAIISIIITVLVESAKRPKLIFEKFLSKLNTYPTNYPVDRRRAKFLYISIKNKSLPKLLNWLGREIAQRCHGRITFYDLEGKKCFESAMPIRWSDTPEPKLITGRSGGKIHREILADFNELRYIDIAPGDTERHDVAVKIGDDLEAYGWSNETYLWGLNHPGKEWRNENRLLTNKKHIVYVEIYSSGRKFENYYWLLNPGPMQDFRLEEISKKQKKSIKKLIEKQQNIIAVNGEDEGV